MRYKIQNIIVTMAVMFTLMVIPAKADDGFRFAIGVKAHSGDIDAKGSETEREHRDNGLAPAAGIQGDELTYTTHSQGVEVGSIFVEASGKQGFVGLTAGFDWIPGAASLGSKSRDDTTVVDGRDSLTYTAKAEVENIITFYLEPTLYLGDTGFGIYAKGGGTTMMLNTLETLAVGTDSAVYPDHRMWGLVQGAGVSYSHPSGLLLKLEHTETNFKNINLDSITGNLNRIEADLDYSATSVAIGWQF